MQITITFEADTLDEVYAKLRAAVRATDEDVDSFLAEVTALENLDDLKPDAPAPPTLDDVDATLREVLNAKDTPKALELLAKFGAKGLKSLPENKYAEFIAAAKEAIR